MNKILISFERGAIVGVIANGDVEVHAEVAETLDGIRQLPVHVIPIADLDALLAGKIQGDNQGANSRRDYVDWQWVADKKKIKH
jgi:hypothetical protein